MRKNHFKGRWTNPNCLLAQRPIHPRNVAEIRFFLNLQHNIIFLNVDTNRPFLTLIPKNNYLQ